MSLKRREPNLSSSQINEEEQIPHHKKVKKTPLSSSQIPKTHHHTFLFHINRGHTKFLQLSNNNYTIQDTKIFRNEFVGINLEEEKLEPIPDKPQEAMEQYLKEQLEGPNQDSSSSSSDEETDPIAKVRKEREKYTVAELEDIRANLIYQLRKDRQKVSDIAETLRISEGKVYYIYSKKEAEIERGVEPKKSKRFLITPEMYKELESFMSLKENSTATLRKMRDHLVEKFHVEDHGISINTISRMLKKLRFSRKRVQNLEPRRNISLNIETRKIVAQKFISAVMSDLEIIFIDETGFYENMAPLYGFSKIGQPCFASARLESVSYSVVAAITKEKILGLQIFKGAVSATCFGGFLVNLLKNNQELLKDRSRYVLFMDNARIHKSKELQPFLKYFNVLYSAPYSPFLNPIEELFGNWKRRFREKFNQNTKNVVYRILEAANEVEGLALEMFYVHSLSFLNDCLNSKEIS